MRRRLDLAQGSHRAGEFGDPPEPATITDYVDWRLAKHLLRTLAARTNKRREIAGLNPLPSVTPQTLRRTYISIMLLASSGDVRIRHGLGRPR